MKYRPLHDLIDPDIRPETDLPLHHDPESPDDAFLIGENGATVHAPDLADGAEGAVDGEAPRRWVKPAALLLAAAAIGLTAWNLSRLVQGPPPPPKPTAFQSKQALYLGVMKIEAYRRTHGVTPDTLIAVGIADGSGYNYRRLDPGRYALSFQGNGTPVEYDSMVPMQQFFGTPAEMLSTGARGDAE